MKFWLLAVLTPGVMAIADSVWELAAEKQHSKQVFVKGISVDGSNIMITVVSAEKDDKSARETVELCSQFPGGDISNTTESLRSDLLRDAFSQGRAITVQFSGTFNRCISKVRASSEATADKTIQSL